MVPMSLLRGAELEDGASLRWATGTTKENHQMRNPDQELPCLG